MTLIMQRTSAYSIRSGGRFVGWKGVLEPELIPFHYSAVGGWTGKWPLAMTIDLLISVIFENQAIIIHVVLPRISNIEQHEFPSISFC